MENINEEHLNLIVKHLRGETSAFEENLLNEWLEENHQNKKTFRETVFLWNAGKTPESHQPDVEAAWQKVKARTDISPVIATPEAKVRPLYDVWTYAKVAASILFFVAVGYIAQTVLTGEEALTVLSSGDRKMEIYLPDSSKVWMNKNTRLTYSESYNENDRTVHLEGEAFFEVRKNREKPFVVNGRLSRTEVLGTSFNVRALPGETSEKVEVMTGKVSFSTGGKDQERKVILAAGDKAALNENGKIEKSRIGDANFLAWKNEQLIFDNTSLADVAAAMEDYFKVPVQIGDTGLNSCRFTGTFTKPDVDEMLKVLALSVNLSYEKKDNAYLLTGKGCD